MQIKQMVTIGLPAKRIKSYLQNFLLWWVKTSESWTHQELVFWFIQSCRDVDSAAYAASVLKRYPNSLDFLALAARNIAA